MVRLTGDGRLWLTEYGQAEREHPYPLPRTGYKGNSVWATPAHLADCPWTGRRSESDGRDRLRTVRAVNACYQSAEANRVVSLDGAVVPAP
jgi:D-apiose dehydrogenase